MVATNSAGSLTSDPAVVSVGPVVAPTILDQPLSLQIDPNTTNYGLYFVPSLAGTAPTSVQWYFNGTAIPGATSVEYEIPDPTSASVGSYTFVAANSAGSVTSAPISVTMDPVLAPVMTVAPIGSEVVAGQAYDLYAIGSFLPGDTYQWYFNGTPLGGNQYDLGFANLSDANAGAYTVTVSNAAGSVTSGPGYISIIDPPDIAAQPQNVSVAAGGTASFSVAISNDSYVQYQWYFNGTALNDGLSSALGVTVSGATSSTLQLVGVGDLAAGSYSCALANYAAEYLSNSATLTISLASAPAFTSAPETESVAVGSLVTFSAAASGNPTPAYQWYFDNVLISGATNASYSIPSAASSNAGTYTVFATNIGGSSSQTDTLSVDTLPALAITTQPVGGAVNLNATYKFSVVATGTPAPTYQWSFNGQPISGATAANYSLTSAQIANSGSFAVTVTNATGSLTSAPAFIVVNAAMGAPTLMTEPVAETVLPGDAVTFNVALSGTVTTHVQPDATGDSAGTYQWFLNGVPVANGTGPTLFVTSVTAANAGSYTCLVTTSAGAVLSDAAVLTLDQNAQMGHLVNVSVLAPLAAGTANNITMGFSTGDGVAASSEPLLVRVTGPALTNFGVSNVLIDPQLVLFNGNQEQIAANQGWASTTANEIQVTALDALVDAFALTNPQSADSALATSQTGGIYTVQASSRSGAAGTLLAEIYDGSSQFMAGVTPRLINVSCLQKLPANGSMTVGFSIAGQTARTVLIRADGPSLAGFHLMGVMADPTLTVYDHQQVVIDSNQGWGGDPSIQSAASAVYAFALSNASSADSAVLVSLSPGTYTVQSSSASGAGGWDLLEVYEVP